jgi:hypothetical protein
MTNAKRRKLWLARAEIVEDASAVEPRSGRSVGSVGSQLGVRVGSSSESTSEVSQGSLVFNETEAVFDSAPGEAETEKIAYTRKRKSAGHRQEMLADLPVETNTDHEIENVQRLVFLTLGLTVASRWRKYGHTHPFSDLKSG